MAQANFDEHFLADDSHQPPYVEITSYLINGKMVEWTGKYENVKSPIWKRGSNQPTIIGKFPMMSAEAAVEAAQAAKHAYNDGRGVWPRLPARERIQYVERYLAGLKERKDEIVNLLMWEICKNKEDSEKEVVRTVKYVEDTIAELKNMENQQNTFQVDGGVFGQIRRAPYGVVLCCGPFNYPFNETYTLLIPALIMGNTVVMKLPRTGVLCHQPTLELFRDIFPPGVVNIVAGSGRETLQPIMNSGVIDVFSFIGTSNAADSLQRAHPRPHRLRVCLGLEAKNAGIVLKSADVDLAVSECLLGSLSFNGQRCTAIKIILVHESIVDQFLPKFCAAVDALKMGLPWEAGVKITPLPEEGKPKFIADLVDDAIAKGARVVNSKYGWDRTLVRPAVVFPVNSTMRVYNEEQFGPLVPVMTFKDIDEVFDYYAKSPYGQQVALFGRDPDELSMLIDVLVNQVARVNINSQCQRGPDSFPFTGRKDSAYGTLSIYDALRVFSIRSCVASKESKPNQELVTNIFTNRKSNYLRLDHLF